MARIKNEVQYPIKSFPNNNDYVIGTDSQNGGITVNFRLGDLLVQSGTEGLLPKGGYDGTAQTIVDDIPVYTSELINDGSYGVQPYVEQDSLDAIQAQVNSIQGILFSDNVNLDTVQEIVDSIENLQTYLSTILVNDLVTGGITKALTAQQGVVLNGLIQDINTELADKVDKVIGERLINAAEIAKLADQSGINTGDQNLAPYQLINEKGQPSGYVPLSDLSKIPPEYLSLVNDLTTGGATSILTAEQGRQIKILIDAINLLLASDNSSLNTLQELVDAIELLQTTLSTLIVNNLTAGGITKALSAEQGKVLKGLIDLLTTNTQAALDLKENAFTKNTAFNKNFGTAAGTVAEGSHVSNLNNPHQVTKTQVGLGNVDNTSDLNKPISTSTQTALNAKADLVGGLIPSNQLPSFVDDVIEVANFASLPTTGEVGKIYIVVSPNNLQYRWGGTSYIQITNGLIASTNDVPEGGSNLYFTVSRVINSILTGLSTASSAIITGADSVLSAIGKLQGQISSHVSNLNNPHSVTKSQVGLSNVDNTSDASKPVSSATQTALNLKANLNAPTFTGIVSGITKSMVGLSNVDNTSDASKPVSSATQTALNLKEDFFTKNTAFNKNFGTTTGTVGDGAVVNANTAKISFDSASSTRLANTSGTNTGDNATNTQYSGLVSNATHTGDVTGSTALTITNGVVSNAKLANMLTKTYKGRTSALTGVPEDVSVTALKADLSLNNVPNTDFTSAVAANTAKVGITTTQANDITANNAKISFDATSSTRLANTSGTNTGDQVLTGLNYAPVSGSANYIQNGTTQQTANLNISGSGTFGSSVKATGGTFKNTLGDQLRIAFNDTFYWKIEREASNGNLLFSDSSNGQRLKIESVSGAATFSSSVAATDGFFSGNLNTSSELRFTSNLGKGILSANGTRAMSITDTDIGISRVLSGTSAAFSSSVTANSLNIKTETPTINIGAITSYAGASGQAMASITSRLTPSGINGGSLDFNVNNWLGGSVPLTRMSILPDGNVGIGTATPSTKLDVAGTFNATGAATFASSVTATDDLSLVIPNSTTGKGVTLKSSTGTEFAKFGVVNPSIDNDSYIGSISNNKFSIYTNNLPRLIIGTTGEATFASSVTASNLSTGGNLNLNGDIIGNGSATLKSIWGGTNSGIVQIKSDAYTVDRYARIGMASATGVWAGGMTINNDLSATFSSSVTAQRYYSSLGVDVYANGAGNDPYGAISVTQPANASSYSYFGMTRAGNIGAGIGITAGNQMWFGTATSGGSTSVLGGSWLTMNGSGATFASSVTANNRTILGAGAIYDNSTNGNDVGIGFGVGVVFPTNGAGSYTLKDLGNNTYKWNSATFSSSVTATDGNFTGKLKVITGGTGASFDIPNQSDFSTEFTNSGSTNIITGKSSSGAGILIASASADTNVNGDFRLSSRNASTGLSHTDLTKDAFVFQNYLTPLLSIKRNGAANFSSSVTAGDNIFINGTGSTNINFQQAGTLKWKAGYASSISSFVFNNGTTDVLKLANAGAATFSGTVTASGGFFNSDRRLKDIFKRDGDVAYYTWKDKRDDKNHIGYVAQEVQEQYPDQVQEGTDGMLSVNYIEVLVAKIQDLEKRLKQLENGI